MQGGEDECEGRIFFYLCDKKVTSFSLSTQGKEWREKEECRTSMKRVSSLLQIACSQTLEAPHPHLSGEDEGQ